MSPGLFCLDMQNIPIAANIKYLIGIVEISSEKFENDTQEYVLFIDKVTTREKRVLCQTFTVNFFWSQRSCSRPVSLPASWFRCWRENNFDTNSTDAVEHQKSFGKGSKQRGKLIASFYLPCEEEYLNAACATKSLYGIDVQAQRVSQPGEVAVKT